MSKVKKWIITSIAIASVFIIILTILLVYYFGASYPEFEKTVKTQAMIPALDEGFTPQGMAVVENSIKIYNSSDSLNAQKFRSHFDNGEPLQMTNDFDGYFIAGYMKDKTKKSRLYHVDMVGENAKYITLGEGAEGLEFSHFGGVAVSGNNVWIATDGIVVRLDKKNIMAAENASSVGIVDKFESGTKASFCYANDDSLFVGEFYRKGSFKTNDNHNIKTSDGQNNAIMCEFDIEENNQFGIKSLLPTRVFSIPNQAQGFAITKTGKMVLSTSYSIPDSKILIFNIDTSVASQQTFEIANGKAPLYILEKSNLERAIKVPTMAEGIDYFGGKLYISFESACKKYSNFNRTRIKNILSIEIA